MAWMRMAGGLVIAGAVLAGCGPKEPAAPEVVPSTQERLESLRAQYQRINPGTRVGQVTAVQPGNRLALVQDIDLGTFRRGDVLVFINANGQTLGTGQVVARTDSGLSVQYDQPATGGRAPQVGDLAVHVPR